jgi:hypothetical protein
LASGLTPVSGEEAVGKVAATGTVVAVAFAPSASASTTGFSFREDVVLSWLWVELAGLPGPGAAFLCSTLPPLLGDPLPLQQPQASRAGPGKGAVLLRLSLCRAAALCRAEEGIHPRRFCSSQSRCHWRHTHRAQHPQQRNRAARVFKSARFPRFLLHTEEDKSIPRRIKAYGR